MFKTNSILSFFFLIIILAFSACKSSDDTMEPEPTRTFADAEADFAALDLSPGIHDVTLEIVDDISYDFRIIAPERAANEDRPLILAFHGATTTDDAHKSTACYIEPGLEALNAFIISPFAEGGLWYEDKNQQMIGDLVFLMKKYWPIEDDKIAVTGYSNGGNASWLFAKFQSSTLSAAIPMASSYDVNEADGSVAKWDIPLYVIHGEDDELFPVDTTQAWVEASINAGSDITFVVATDLGHYMPCDYVPYLQDAAIWLKETVWME